MPLTLRLDATEPSLKSYAGRRISVDSVLTIGRGMDNDLVLPDPSRVLSKNHCVIEFDHGGYIVTDRSTNGVFLNGGPDRLPRDVPMPLGPGDYLQLGDFSLTVEAITAAAPRQQAYLDPAPAAPPYGGADPFDDLLGDGGFSPSPPPPRGLSALPEDPLDFGFDSTSSNRGPGASGGVSDDALFGFGAPASGSGSGGLLPDDEDIFGKPLPRDDWKGPSMADDAASPSVAFVPPRVTTEMIPDDWDPLNDLGVSPPPLQPAAPRQPTAADPFADLDDFRPAPSVARPGPASVFAEPNDAPTPRPPRPAQAADPAADRAMLRAFTTGLGVDAGGLSDAQALALMTTAGRMLRAVSGGLMEILSARASTKEEFRIERTVIGAKGNNPLKFAGSVDEAVQSLLLLSVPGFLKGEAAIDEAIKDIKAHELAMLAGMQVALNTLVARFDPQALQQRLERNSVFDGILPGARKARYWELFIQLYKEIAGELEDDFQGLFGKEFASAYKQQIDRL